jgi:hypothetical protein
MRKLITATILGIFATMPVQANDTVLVENIGDCLAFAYVRAGLDGTKEIPADLVAGLSFLRDEFETRAANAGLDEAQRQKIIVLSLQEKNIVVQTEGMDALEARYNTLCQNMALTFADDVEGQAVKTDNLGSRP